MKNMVTIAVVSAGTGLLCGLCLGKISTSTKMLVSMLTIIAVSETLKASFTDNFKFIPIKE